MTHVVSCALSILLACACLFGAPAARALDTGDIVIASAKGDVQVTMRGAVRAVRAGTVLELPATVRTGRDGAVELRQGATSVSVGPDTLLEFPALETRGGPIDRIAQPHGNAFYDIGKRAGRKLRVETPYLVGVVKGTQFNVAAQDDSTTISLFEGALEIRASDDSSVVDIRSGEIATRRRGDKGIDVLKMDGGKLPSPRSPAGAGSSGENSPGGAPDPAPVDGGADRAFAGRDEILPARGMPVAIIDGLIDTAIEVRDLGAGALAGVDPGTGIDVGADAAVAGVAANVVEVGNGVDLGVSTGIDVGSAAAVDLGAGANIDVGSSIAAGVDVNAGVGAGSLSADLGAGAVIDLGGSQNGAHVDLGATVGVTDPVAVDVGAGAAVNVDTDAGVGVTADVGASVGGVDTSVNAGADVGTGTVNVGVSVGGVDVGVGLDLGLDDNSGPGSDNSGHGSDSSGSGSDNSGHGNANDVVDTVDNLLNGLLRRPGKK